MFTRMGYGVYFFFASLMMCSIVFVWFLVPETKGVPLESVDRLFEIMPTRKAHGIAMQELKERDEEFREHVKQEGLDLVLGDEVKGKAAPVQHVENA